MTAPVTPDGRHFVVRGRLWRCPNSHLNDAQRAELVTELMSARRAKQAAMRTGDVAAREVARARVDAAKVALGERGPVWWDDGAADLNRHLARTTPYADWFASAQVAPFHLTHRAAFAHGVIDGRTAQEFEPQGKAAKEVDQLYKWLCGIVGMPTRGQAETAARRHARKAA